MQRFKDILVVSNSAVGDEATLARAMAVAKRNRARLTVTTVLRNCVATGGVRGVDGQTGRICDARCG